LVADAANWVAGCESTQFAVAATNHSVLRSNEMRTVEMRSDEVWSGEMSNTSTHLATTNEERATCKMYTC